MYLKLNYSVLILYCFLIFSLSLINFKLRIMANIKIVLRKNMMKKDGSIPLALRISENYKTNYQWLGQYVFEKDWDKVKGKVKRTHPNFQKLNNFLLKNLRQLMMFISTIKKRVLLQTKSSKN